MQQEHSGKNMAMLLASFVAALTVIGYLFVKLVKELSCSNALLSQWHQIVFNARLGVALVSAYDNKLILFNPAFAAMCGGGSVTPLGLALEDLIAPSRKEELARGLESILVNGHCHLETELMRHDNSTLPVLLNGYVIRNESAGTNYIAINVTDLSEQRLLEQQLSESESCLAQIQGQVCMGNWQLDARVDCLHWSEECRRIFGVKGNEPLTYHDFLQAVHPDDRQMVDSSWQATLQGKSYDIQHRIIVTGKTRWVREIAQLVFEADGSVSGGVGTVQDITAMKLKELELLRSRQMVRELAAHNERIREEERGRISRELHDEMGQWLTAIRLDASTLLMRSAPPDPELNSTLKDMKANIDHTIKVVREIASSVRPEALDAGLLPAARWLLSSFQARTSIQCTLEVQPDDFDLDEGRTIAAFRILQESLTNVSRHALATEVIVVIARDSQQLTMSIRDNGLGLDTNAVRGKSGFGLLGMRERALIFGGESCIRNDPNGGARVSVRIPLECPELERALI